MTRLIVISTHPGSPSPEKVVKEGHRQIFQLIGTGSLAVLVMSLLATVPELPLRGHPLRIAAAALLLWGVLLVLVAVSRMLNDPKSSRPAPDIEEPL